MRILHVVEATIAGVRNHVQQLAVGLQPYGFQSLVACPLRRQNSFGDEAFVDYLTSVGVSTVPVAMQRSISPRADIAALHRLVALLRQQHFDIIHLHSSKAGLLGRVAAKIVGGRAAVIYSPHGLAFLGNYGWLQRQFYLRLEQIAGRMCDRIIAVSPSERDLVISERLAPADRVSCVDLGVDPNPILPASHLLGLRLSIGVPDHAIVIGTLARATPQKNPLLFVEAAAQVLRAAPRAYFVWCGDGELRAAAATRAQQLGVSDRCRFIGHREDARQVLAVFDCFWLTSNYESFGLATAEAMAQSLPVIATAVAGTRDVVADGVTGILVPPRDAAALADATLDLIAHPDRARSLGAAGRVRVLQHFTTDHMLQAMAKVYYSALEARGCRAARPARAPAVE